MPQGESPVSEQQPNQALNWQAKAMDARQHTYIPAADAFAPTAGVNRQMYDQLKQQVQQLKVEQKTQHAYKAQQRELESVALLQQKLQYEEQLDSQQQEITSLQQRLKENVDRASKVRQLFEKDKKVLAQQVDKLQESLSQLERQHVEQLAAKDSTHLQQLQEIRDQLEQRQQDWAAERQALQDKQAAFIADVEEWSQGEVEAIQAAAAERLQRKQAAVSHWQACHTQVQAELQAAREQMAELDQQLVNTQQELQAAREQCDASELQAQAATSLLQQRLDAAEQRLLEKQRHWEHEQQQLQQHWQQQLLVAQREHHAKECELKAQHALELDAVHVRLQTVLAKKDSTIGALRAELAATFSKLQQAEDLLDD